MLMLKLAEYLGHNQIETPADHDEASEVIFNGPRWSEATRGGGHGLNHLGC
jgi:hypothetical protein